MASRPRHFKTEILKQGPNPYVEIPSTVSDTFAGYAEQGRIRVYGTLEGAEIRGNLVPRGGGHWLFLHSGMRAAAGVGVGDTIEVVLSAAPWDQVPTPGDAKAALEKADALQTFEAMSPSQRHELLRWVETADSVEKRAKRLCDMVEQVRGETEPAKKGQASRRRKPLWTCPKCEHVFVNTNQWHSCKRFTLEQTFARSEPPVRDLFERLRTMIESVGPVHVQAYRDHVSFLVRVRFLSATPRKRWLDVGFRLPHRIDSPRFRKVETLTPTDHTHILRVAAEYQLDEQVMGWIREGYAVGEQNHFT